MTPLPPDQPAVLLATDLARLGLPPDRARRSDLERVGQGFHRQRAHPGTGWADLGLPEPGHGFSPDHLAALLRRRPDAVLSHETAAHLHGLPMPARAWRRRDPATGELDVDPPVHLTVARGTRRVRRAGLMDHRRPLAPEFVTHVHGLRVTTVDRTWLDLCSLTPPWTFEDLVAAGDHAVRHPWTPAGRTDPATTIAALRSALHASGRFHGRPAAREALDSVRVGADSPPETRLRLALVAGGLPEPGLQAALEPEDPFSPVADVAYRHVRLALQYDGARLQDGLGLPHGLGLTHEAGQLLIGHDLGGLL
ncbi:hypothetical protein, partial [Micrococcus luteus]|uniref:hypothetical protein n=1 Tax=Micrococcus luteus TaxID=1270 RepID=UPI0033C0A8A7